MSLGHAIVIVFGDEEIAKKHLTAICKCRGLIGKIVPVTENLELEYMMEGGRMFGMPLHRNGDERCGDR